MTKRPNSSREPASAKGPIPIVFVIDDDASMRRALGNLFPVGRPLLGKLSVPMCTENLNPEVVVMKAAQDGT